jgi:hypothetical protein
VPATTSQRAARPAALGAAAAALLLLLLAPPPPRAAAQGPESTGSIQAAFAAAAGPGSRHLKRAKAVLNRRPDPAGGDDAVTASATGQMWPLQDTIMNGLSADVVNMTCPTLA